MARADLANSPALEGVETRVDCAEEDLEQQIAGVAALDEPVRRELYRYVAGQSHAVSRDEAAAALGISRALAAFHLDKLVAEGLLAVEYKRLTDRTGPGAGRPSKLYRRSGRQITITFPPRSYELAARLFAQAIDGLRSPAAEHALQAVARDWGQTIGENARNAEGARHSSAPPGQSAYESLSLCGYEPVQDGTDDIRLRNCPFHNLTQEHRELVCGMNLALLKGLLDGLELPEVEAILDPQPGMCCVRLHAKRSN